MNIFQRVLFRRQFHIRQLGTPAGSPELLDERIDFFRMLNPNGFKMPAARSTHIPKKRSEGEMLERRVRKPLGRNYCRK